MMTYLEIEESTEHNPILNSEAGAKELQGKELSKTTGTKKKTKWLNIFFGMGFNKPLEILSLLHVNHRKG